MIERERGFDVGGACVDAGRELACRLDTVSEQKKRAQEALRYNPLVRSWPEIARLAREAGSRPEQTEMFERGHR